MKQFIFLLIALAHCLGLIGQALRLSLEDAIEIARTKSVDALVAHNTQDRAYWKYRTYRASRLPEILFESTLPSYQRNYASYQHSDGSYSFLKNDFLELSAGLQIEQNIPLTGGKISLNSSLDFIKQIGGASEFMSLPIELTLSQRLFGVNDLKWAKRIEPVRYDEAKREYSEDIIELSLSATAHYFNALLAKSALDIARQNKESADELFAIAQHKRKMGKISQQEMSQLQLQALQAKASLTSAESSMRAQEFALTAFLGFDEAQEIEITTPENLPFGRLDYLVLMNVAMQQSAFAKSVIRKGLEADYAVATARGNRRAIELFASFGYAGVGKELSKSYRGLVNNQVISVGMSIPILDWGKRKAQVRSAESNQSVVKAQIEQETISFRQDVFLLTENYNNQASQVEIAREANTIARNNYDVALQIFISGDSDILALNDARSNRDAAEQKLLEEIYMYWNYYYQIEMLSLEKMDDLIARSR